MTIGAPVALAPSMSRPVQGQAHRTGAGPGMVRRRRLQLHSPGPTVPLLRAAAGPLSLREI